MNDAVVYQSIQQSRERQLKINDETDILMDIIEKVVYRLPRDSENALASGRCPHFEADGKQTFPGSELFRFGWIQFHC